MNKRIDAAIKDYEMNFDGTAKGHFYAADLYEINALTEDLNKYDSLYQALKAGFMIGYRVRCTEIVKAQKEILNG